MYATKLGDIAAIKRFLLMGHDIHCKDYDNRTVLHVAAAEGDVVTLEYVLSKWHEDLDPHDRYDRTPLDDAEHFCDRLCLEYPRYPKFRPPLCTGVGWILDAFVQIRLL